MDKIIFLLAILTVPVLIGGCVATSTPAPTQLQNEEAQRLARTLNCVACHAENVRVVGPSWIDVGRRYKGATHFEYNRHEYPLVEGLTMKVSHGGSGEWGPMPMPAIDPTGIKQSEITELVRYVLSFANYSSNFQAAPSDTVLPQRAIGNPIAGPAYYPNAPSNQFTAQTGNTATIGSEINTHATSANQHLAMVDFPASIDCRKSHTFIEKAICSDKPLLQLDGRLGQAYKDTLEDSSTPDDVKIEQYDWLKNVRDICQDKECLVREYTARIKQLGPSPTSTYNFVGTSWRSPSAYNDVVEFREGGVVAHKSARGVSYGQWKVEKGVLLFDNNNFSHYKAKLDGDWLVVNGNNPAANWTARWYRTDNEDIDKGVRKDLDQSIEQFHNAIEAHRLSVLSESPETEAMLQEGRGEQYGGKHWLNLCDDINLRLKAISIASITGTSQSELCYNWYGTRHDWKEAILKEGCLGRCRP